MAIPEASLLAQLAANSDPYRDPLAAIDWRRLDRDAWWLPPEAVSLFGLAEFDALSHEARVRLSQYELIAAMQAGLALERMFLEQTTRRLRRARPLAEYAYLLHEVREESGHSLMFLRLIAESGLTVPQWRASLPRSAALFSRLLFAEPLYWVATFVAEDVPDRFNRFVRRHAGSDVCPVVRQVVSLHMMDEARHIAYARKRLETVLGTPGRRRRFAAPLYDSVFNRFVQAYFWPRAEIYELAGLGDGTTWRSLALRNPRRREFVVRLLAPTVRALAAHGITPRLR